MSILGFVGLGRMGGAMAARLAARGHEIVAFDPAPAAREAARGWGARLVGSPRAVADEAAVVFLSLPHPQVVLDTVVGANALRQGQALELCVDLSTSGPQVAQQLAAGLALHGVDSIEAPVSGGIKGAREGTLALMAAGPEAAFERAREFLEIFGKPFYMGTAPGAGQTMKLVNNLLGACAIAITSEGMALGIKAGLDPKRMIDVLNVSSGRSSATLDKWPRSVLPRTFDFGFAAGLCLKDIRLCLDSARDLKVPVPVADAVGALLERTVATLGQDADFTAMARIVEADAGLDPDRPA